MPLYEYQCQKCGHVMEVLQKISDPPLRRCKACRGKVEKMISRTAFLLKGGGWFNEGYSRDSGAKKSDTGSDGADKAATKSDASKKETKSKKKKKKKGAAS